MEMTMGKTISLKGEAAGAFIRMAKGETKDELDEYRQVATALHMEMKSGHVERAAKKLQTYVDAKIRAFLEAQVTELKKRIAEVPKLHTDRHTPPNVGDEIYVGTHMYIDHGEDDVAGGLAVVTKVERSSTNGGTWSIYVKEHPGCGYYWD